MTARFSSPRIPKVPATPPFPTHWINISAAFLHCFLYLSISYDCWTGPDGIFCLVPGTAPVLTTLALEVAHQLAALPASVAPALAVFRNQVTWGKVPHGVRRLVCGIVPTGLHRVRRDAWYTGNTQPWFASSHSSGISRVYRLTRVCVGGFRRLRGNCRGNKEQLLIRAAT